MEQTKYLWGVAVVLIAVSVLGYLLMSSSKDKTDENYNYNHNDSTEVIEDNKYPKIDDSGQATFITPDKKAINFGFNGGYETVIIGADGRWSVSDCPNWIKTYNKDGEIVINTENNETGSARDGCIKLSGNGDVTATINVTQASKCTHITPAIDKVKFNKEGGTQIVQIDTDGMPQVEAPEGFSASYTDGELTINAFANKKGAKNSVIKLTCDDQRASINVSQKGNICPKCNGKGKIKCTSCNGHGAVTIYLPSGWDDDHGCYKCGGSGHEDDGSLRYGSGRIKCPKCGGRGY